MNNPNVDEALDILDKINHADVDTILITLIGIAHNGNVSEDIKNYIRPAIQRLKIYSPSIRKSVRKEAEKNRKFLFGYLVERDGKRCVFCGEIDGTFHIDHIKPISKGGDNSFDNFQLLCERCNLQKSNKYNQELWT